MLTTEQWFWLGNIACIIGDVLLAYAIVKDRNVLRGISGPGAILTLIGVLMFAAGYATMPSWTNIALVIPTVVMWGIASASTLRLWVKKHAA